MAAQGGHNHWQSFETWSNRTRYQNLQTGWIASRRHADSFFQDSNHSVMWSFKAEGILWLQAQPGCMQPALPRQQAAAACRRGAKHAAGCRRGHAAAVFLGGPSTKARVLGLEFPMRLKVTQIKQPAPRSDSDQAARASK